VSIAERAVVMVQDKIYLITGGFHLGGTSKREIDNIIKELKAIGVEKIGPSHCTGQQAIESFRNAWGKNFIDGDCGTNIQIRR
jgi:7,8-dihydropterin-6-yl-methyl-4-(beta-D-ribofuranosyl)aminobenzene 5'-phosphate synthase